MNPQERVLAYLNANQSSLQYATSVDEVVKGIKLFVFYGSSPISDDEIRKVITPWAITHAVGILVRPGTVGSAPVPQVTPSNSDSELIDAVKKAVTTINKGVTIGRDAANINIGVSGATANLKQGDNSASLGISWGGTLKLEAASGPIHFEGNLSKDKWEITVSYPQDTYIPNLTTLGTVFTKAEQAVGSIAEATKSFNNLSDTVKVAALIKPQVTAVQDAVEAVKGIADAPKKGGASFGFKFGSPDPGPGQQGMQGGVQGQIVFSYTF
jgi:hypothetical protein